MNVRRDSMNKWQSQAQTVEEIVQMKHVLSSRTVQYKVVIALISSVSKTNEMQIYVPKLGKKAQEATCRKLYQLTFGSELHAPVRNVKRYEDQIVQCTVPYKLSPADTKTLSKGTDFVSLDEGKVQIPRFFRLRLEDYLFWLYLESMKSGNLKSISYVSFTNLLSILSSFDKNARKAV